MELFFKAMYAILIVNTLLNENVNNSNYHLQLIYISIFYSSHYFYLIE